MFGKTWGTSESGKGSEGLDGVEEKEVKTNIYKWVSWTIMGDQN